MSNRYQTPLDFPSSEYNNYKSSPSELRERRSGRRRFNRKKLGKSLAERQKKHLNKQNQTK